jgi:site-specific DNA recombinase
MYRATALYARVSSDRQAREGTIESQLAALRNFVVQQGWAVDPDREFIDNGVSGTTLDRPALDRLRDAIAGGQIQRVVVLSSDRLSRNFVHQEYLREEWAGASCELVYVQEPPIETPQDLLASRVRGIFAEYERLVFLERMRRGLSHRARRGEPPPTAPWGYRYVPGEGGVPAHWEIEPRQAEWVRAIYRWLWEEHLGVRAIARRLIGRGVPPPGGGPYWHESTVHRILTNPVYQGEAFYHRTSSTAEGLGDGHGRKVRPEEEWIRIAVPVIVSPEEREMAQEELARHRQLAQRHARSRHYLLQGLVRCGSCGRRLAGRECGAHLYYVCRSKRHLQPEERCASRWVRAEALEGLVWGAVLELLLSPQQVLASYQEQREAWLQGEKEQERQTLEREAKVLRLRRQRLIDAYELGVISLEELVRRRQRLEGAQRELARRQREWELRQQHCEGFARALSELERYRTTIQESLDSLNFEQQREILTLLVEEVVVHEDKIIIRHILPVDRALRSPHRPPRGGWGRRRCARSPT